MKGDFRAELVSVLFDQIEHRVLLFKEGEGFSYTKSGEILGMQIFLEVGEKSDSRVLKMAEHLLGSRRCPSLF